MKVRKIICLLVFVFFLFLVPSAVFASDTYTVTFNSNGGSEIDSISVNEGSMITEPSAPTREGFTFAGWYKDEALNNTWDFEDDAVISDITLYAKWKKNLYCVSFNSEGGSAVDAVWAFYNTLISEPPAPTKTGYTFGGWYKNEVHASVWDFSSDTMPAKHIILYAKWIPNNINEVNAIKDFLDQPSAVAGKTNGDLLNRYYDQYFTESYIDGSYYITSINISDKKVAGNLNLDGFTKLREIHISYTDINSISINNSSSLESVFLSMNYNLSSVNITNSAILESINCTNNRIVTLKVGKAPKLNELICYCNYKMTSLSFDDITTLTVLKCNGNELSALDVSKNTRLVTLDCSFNKISNIDLSKNTSLTSLSCSYNLLTSLNISSQEKILTKLYCYNNKILSLNLSNCVNLEYLGCSNNKLTSLNVSNNSKLKSLNCGYNYFNAINLSNNILLESLGIDKLGISKLDTSNFTQLRELSCEYNTNLTSLDLSKNLNLTRLSCSYCNLTSLDLSNNKLLELVYCDGNNISSLDFSKNPELAYLRCINNGLESLDITKNVNLWDAACQLNSLTSLDISNNTKLYALDCGSNSLTSLNLYNNCDLYRLNCENNAITQLDTSNNLKLEILVCDSNFLTSIDVSKNVLLRYFRCENNQLKYIKYIYKNVISDIAAEGSGYVTIKIDTYNPPYIEIFAHPCSGASFINWSQPNTIYSMDANSRISSAMNNTLTANFGLAAPKITSAKPSSYNSITLAWSPVSGAINYDIYRATSSTGTYAKVDTVSSISYTDTNLTTGKYYYYKIQAAYTSGSQTTYSSFSAVKYAKPIPATPVITSIASTGYDRIKLGWNAVEGATGYKVYRATSSSGTYTYLGATTSTSYTSKGLTSGKYYYYKVLAYTTANGVTTYSSYSSVKYSKVIPSTPTASAASYSYNSIRVGWNAVSGASGYELYRATSEAGSYSLLKVTTSSYYIHTSLSTGSTYYYKVRAYRLVSRTKVYGAFSSVISAMPVPSAPVPSAVSAGYTSNKISWSAVSGASGYELYKTDVNGEIQSQLDIATETAISYTHEGLTTNAPYYYKVKAYRTVNGNKVYGPYSKIATATPVPSAPTVKVTLNSYSSLNIAWNKIDGAEKYEISRSTSSASGYAPIYTTDDLSYTDVDLITGVTYYYKVRALIEDTPVVYGDYSKVTSLKVIPATPVITVSANTYTSLKISWNAVDGATGYKVYRATSSKGTYTYLGATTSTSFASTGLATGKYYYYKVLAYTTANGVTTYSAYSAVKYAKVAPSVPTVSAESYSSNSIKVSWGAVSGATMYELYWSTSETVNYTLLKSTTATYFIHTQLSEGSAYYYKVRAYHLEGSTKVYSLYSQTVSAAPAP